MKYLLFIILIIASLITAGCVAGNQNTAVTPTPQIVYVTVFVTPTQAPTPQPTYDAEANCRRLDGYYNSNTGECHFPTPTKQTFTPSPTSQTTSNGNSETCWLAGGTYNSITGKCDISHSSSLYNTYTQPQRTSAPSPTQTPTPISWKDNTLVCTFPYEPDLNTHTCVLPSTPVPTSVPTTPVCDSGWHYDPITGHCTPIHVITHQPQP